MQAQLAVLAGNEVIGQANVGVHAAAVNNGIIVNFENGKSGNLAATHFGEVSNF